MNFTTVKKVMAVLSAVMLLLSGCNTSSQEEETPFSETPATSLTSPSKPIEAADISVDASWTDDDTAVGAEGAVAVTLSDEGSRAEGDGVSIDGSVITITQSGVYSLSGSLSNGQIRVESPNDGNVQLILSGVTVHSQSSAPLYVKKANKVILTLAEGTQNRFSDSAAFTFEDETEEEPSATLFSKSDLTVNGGGTLTVEAVFRDGIVSRDGLKIADGHVIVTAADDAVMGRDYVLMGGGTLTLHAEGDGIKSTNDGGDSVGFVLIENGTVNIVSGSDGIQAASSLTVNGGTITVTSGGGSAAGTAANSRNDFRWGGYYETTETSSVGKGLKAGTVLTVSGGTVSIDAADDALHANVGIVMNGGNVEAAAGDDGMHADEELLISDGTLTITKSYEGLEAGIITIDGGKISVTASDDGVNASYGTTSSNDPMASDGSSFVINGGTLHVDAQGDGLDSNGTIQMSGGTVAVVGPSNGGNGTFDYASAFRITGGELIAIGSTGMAETPSNNAMNSVVWAGFSMTSGDRFTVTDANGNEVASVTATRAAGWAYYSSPTLETDASYTLTCGSATQTITMEEGVNTIGNAGGMGGFGGGFGGGGGRPGGRPF